MRHRHVIPALFLAAGSLLLIAQAPPQPDDKIKGFEFRVEIEGLEPFTPIAVGGLDIEVEVVENLDPATGILRKRPGVTKFGNITLKRGYQCAGPAWDWFTRIQSGVHEPRNGSIILLDNSHEYCRYNFFDAWPCKWKGWSLDGKDNGVAIEEIELCVEEIRIE